MTGRGGNTERGASLISALMLVAVMSSLAMVLAGELRFAMRRSANMEVRDQAYWYAMGARDFTEGLIGQAMENPVESLRPDAAWLGEPRIFPIEAGSLAGTVRDGNNCFNLNALVTASERGVLEADPVQLTRFEQLLRAIDIPGGDAVRIAAQAADWIDSDVRPLPSGGEDDVYARPDRPVYRTGNTLMAEREELLALEAVTPDLYRRMAPFVCARPDTAALPLNLNTLTLEQWPLLAALFEGALTRVAAEGILLQRPEAGFASANAFWNLDTVAALEADATLREAVGIDTRYFELRIDVVHAGQDYRLDGLVEVLDGGLVRRVSQRYGNVT